MTGILVPAIQKQGALTTKIILLISISGIVINFSLIDEEKHSLDYDDKLDKLILESHTLPCVHSESFSKATLKYPYNFVRFPEEKCLLFHNYDFIGLMSKLNNSQWLET